MTGVALLGLIAAMGPVLALMSGDGGGDPEMDAVAEGEPKDQPNEADLLDDPDNPPDAEEPAGPHRPVDYEYILGAGDHAIDRFAPGEDRLLLTSNTWDFDLAEAGSSKEAVLEITIGTETSSLSFPGLDLLPVDDIFLAIAELDTQPIIMPLTDALQEDDEDILTPTDPEEPDDFPQQTDSAKTAPADPDAEDTPPGDPSTIAPLPPIDADEPDA